MGHSCSARFVVGIDVTRSDFFTKVDSVLKCRSGHVSTLAGAKYCSRCAEPVRYHDVETPTASFAAFCLAEHKQPDVVWDNILNPYRKPMGVFPLCRNHEEDNGKYVLGLAIEVADYGLSFACVDDAMAKAFVDVPEFARKLGINYVGRQLKSYIILGP